MLNGAKKVLDGALAVLDGVLKAQKLGYAVMKGLRDNFRIELLQLGPLTLRQDLFDSTLAAKFKFLVAGKRVEFSGTLRVKSPASAAKEVSKRAMKQLSKMFPPRRAVEFMEMGEYMADLEEFVTSLQTEDFVQSIPR